MCHKAELNFFVPLLAVASDQQRATKIPVPLVTIPDQTALR